MSMTIRLQPKLAFVVCVVVSLCLSIPLYAQDADKIYPVTGAPKSGTIAEMTRNGVVMEIRGVKENFPANTIQRIVYEGEPAQLTKAKDAVQNEQWQDAVDELKKVDFRSITRDEIKKEFEFFVAIVQANMAMNGQGDPAAAEQKLLAFVSTSAQSFHFFDTADALGTLASAIGGYDRAVKYYTGLAASPFVSQKIKAQYMLGNSNLAINKIAEAKTAFNEAKSASAEDAAAKRYQKLAEVGLIRCETADKKYEAAIDKLRKLVSDSDSADGELFARIYNALGEAHLQAGQEEEAILAYLHTDLLFSNNPDSHAEALHYLVKLFTKLDPSRVQDAKARLQSYSNSPWAKKG